MRNHTKWPPPEQMLVFGGGRYVRPCEGRLFAGLSEDAFIARCVKPYVLSGLA